MTSELDLNAGGAIFSRLHRLGVEVVFVNSGTDFPPVIEGLAEAEAHDVELPRALLVSHEHVAMGMAHGHWLATGSCQAVMLHTNVGLANGAIGAINAATDNVPMILMSGRTPTTEQGRFGSRTVPIGWGQEMSDQAALVRGSVKWEYELRFPEQIGDVLDRAHAIASSTPAGPTYLSLPREVLCEPCPTEVVDRSPGMAPSVQRASTNAIDDVATLLAAAERPIIIAQRGAGGPDGFAGLARFADDHSIPVSQYWAVAAAIAADHPMHVGGDPGPWLADADVVVVVDGLAPWVPEHHEPPSGATVVHIGPDPLQSRFPIRNFRCDIAVASETELALVALAEALAQREPTATSRARRERIEAAVAGRRAMLAEQALPGSDGSMTKAHVAAQISKAVNGLHATVLSELGAPMEHVAPMAFDAWRDAPHSGGLGWGLPTALGVKLGNPSRTVVATMGDGSYIFANPVACHQVAHEHGLPILTVVLNNSGYGAVRRSVAGMYPTGYAAKADTMPLTGFTSPDFVRIAEACGAWSRHVAEADELPAVLQQALEVVQGEQRQALVEVAVAGG